MANEQAGFDVGKLFENKLFLQYLSGMGGAMSAGEPVGPALNQVTQQNISSQNYMKLLAKMMKGEIPEGGSHQVTTDAEGTKMTFKMPKNVLGGTAENTVLAQQGAGLPGGSGTDWSFLNPSSSPVSSSADLAGLTPEMISQALKFKLAGEEMEQKKITDYTDMIYKKALTEQALATAEKTKPSITIPGTDIKLSQDQWVEWYKAATKDERTSAIKNYEYAQSKGYSGSFEQFQDLAKTTHQKDFEQAKSGGYTGSFNQWMFDMAKAGAINLGDVVERKKATEDIDAQKYFTNPKGLAADIDKYIASEEVQNQLFAYATDPKKRETETIRAKENYIIRKIAAAGGQIISSKLDGRTFVFKVKWPDGDISEVRYAN
jgi:hypothetical protein